MGVIFDLDQTLINSNVAREYRNARQWGKVYDLVNRMTVFDGIMDVLQILRQNNVKIAIVTSSPRSYCEKIVNYFDISADVIVCYHDTFFHKPNPEPIFKAVELLNEEPKYIYSVGDEEKDIVASNRAGVVSCYAKWGVIGDEITSEKSNFEFNSVGEMERFFNRLFC